MARLAFMLPRFAGFGPRFFSFLLKSREQLKVTISLILQYLQFVQLTILFFRAFIFLFGPELPAADRSFFTDLDRKLRNQVRIT
jgi:hypothetical protein